MLSSSGAVMIGKIAQLIKTGLRPVTKLLVKLGVSANAVTIAGFTVSVAGAFGYGKGWFVLGGIAVLLGGLFDMIDGEISRLSNRVTRFGAFLDSTLDRCGECFIFAGIAIHTSHIDLRYSLLALLALCGSMLVSYTRARAEGLGLPGRVGFFERGVRFFFIVAGSFLGVRVMAVMLLILVLGTLSTIIHRILFVLEMSKVDDRPGADGKPR